MAEDRQRAEAGQKTGTENQPPGIKAHQLPGK
jgi:hypothetical protein